ncbi:MAG: prolipoprotein diacylglyceryl transferase [Solirubrobacterales bacterium]
MNPVAFSVFGLDIMWYGILIALGVIAAITLSQYTCKLNNTSFDEIMNIFLIAFPSGVVGARIYYVVFQFDYYRNNLIDIFNVRQGGLAIHGGIIFSMAATYIYTRVKRDSFLKYADTAAPCIVLAQGIGRWGNFFNSEAHGGPVTQNFIQKFPEFIQKGMYINGSYYHPTFLYESLWDITVCIILILILRKSPRKGTVIALYIGLYSLGRFFIEGLRTDSLMFGSLRMAQVVSLVGILICIVGILFIYGRKRISNK